jgi:hypothetical protein
MRRLGILGVVGMALLGCGGLSEDVNRAQASYEDARYQDALVWLEHLEARVPDMNRDVRTRFYYVWGMTAYRLGQRDDALYYLALAREEARLGPGGLTAEQQQEMDRTLGELTPTGATSRAEPPSVESAAEGQSDDASADDAPDAQDDAAPAAPQAEQ